MPETAHELLERGIIPQGEITDRTHKVSGEVVLSKSGKEIEALNWIFAEAIQKPLNIKRTIPRKPKVYYVNYDNFGPGYYRCAVPGLAMRQIGYMDAIFREEIQANVEDVDKTINWADVLFWQRVTDLNALQVFREVQQAGKAIIFEADDFVDDIANTSDPRVKKYWNKEAVSNFTECAKAADGLIMSTKRLTDRYRDKTGNKAYWVPNGLDTRNFRWNIPFEKYDTKGYITIGYMGGSTHGQDLEVCRKPLLDLLNKHKDVKIKFVGFIPEWGIDIRESQVILDPEWRSIQEYPLAMADIDIGIVPLKNMPFNQIGKSCLKYLEYTMVGAATIASKVGETGDEIKNNKTGFTPSTEDGWEVYLKRLIENPEQITLINKNAVQYLLTYRSIDVMIDKWLYAINCIIDKRVKLHEGIGKTEKWRRYSGRYS